MGFWSKLTSTTIALLLCVNCATRFAQTHTYVEANYVPAEGNSFAQPLNQLINRLTSNGIHVELSDEMNGWGMTQRTPVGIFISLNSSLSIDGQFEVLAHEAGHLFHPPIQELAVREIIAEKIGIGVQEFYGSKTARLKGNFYLLQHKQGFASLKFVQVDIDRAIQVITGRRPWSIYE